MLFSFVKMLNAEYVFCNIFGYGLPWGNFQWFFSLCKQKWRI